MPWRSRHLPLILRPGVLVFGMSSVPFTVGDVYSSLAELEGVVRMEENGLALDFRVTDAVLHVMKSQPQEARIPWTELEEITFTKGLFRCALHLRTRGLKAFSAIPGSNGSEMILRCKRKYAEAARELASNAAMRIVEHQLRALASANQAGTSPRQ